MSAIGRDRDILRRLGAEVAEIAALPVQAQTREAWIALNGLRPVRPLVRMDQIPWGELEAVTDELALHCEDSDHRVFERTLRRIRYQWRHMRLDMVVEPVVEVTQVVASSGFGVDVEESVLSDDPHGAVASHGYVDQLTRPEDVARLHTPQLAPDAIATERLAAKALAAFDGVLDVRLQGVLPHWGLWDEIVKLRDAQTLLFDLAARPEHMHAIAERYTSAVLGLLDQLETQGLLGHDQAVIHCTGAWTDELPVAGYDPARPRARDLWTFGQAQILASVSPDMYEEFEIPYATRWYERFGLGYYGCCDALHDRVDIVRRIPNVRKISMSPWADVEAGAAAIGRDYVFSWKPNPAHLARDGFPAETIEREMRSALAACEQSGSPLEIILKDLSTVRGRPERLWRWAGLAHRVTAG